VWNIVAAVLLLAVLGAAVMDGKDKVAAAETRLLQVKRQVSAVSATNTEAVAMIEQNKVDRALVDHLATQALPLNGLLRTLRAVSAHLPPPLWVDKIEVGAGGQSGAQTQRKSPVITVSGGGKELDGVNVNSVFQEAFYSPLSKELEAGGDTKVELLTPSGTGQTLKYQFAVRFVEVK